MISTIEQAIVDLITAASDNDQLGYKLKTIDSYGNELDKDLAELARGKFPAVFVVFEGRDKPSHQGGDLYRHTARFGVLSGTSNRRSEKSRRRGAAGKPGSYQILGDVEKLLVNDTLGLSIEALAPGPTSSLVNGSVKRRNISIYKQTFFVTYVEDYAVDAAGLDDFKFFNADYDVPPHGNVTDPLPAAESDATDTVTLPQE